MSNDDYYRQLDNQAYYRQLDNQAYYRQLDLQNMARQTYYQQMDRQADDRRAYYAQLDRERDAVERRKADERSQQSMLNALLSTNAYHATKTSAATPATAATANTTPGQAGLLSRAVKTGLRLGALAIVAYAARHVGEQARAAQAAPGTCSSCGAQLAPEHRFCIHCGTAAGGG